MVTSIALGPVQWGDVSAWFTASVALLALIAAGVAYSRQAQAVRQQGEQLELQRRQLADQQEANRKQAQVVDEQLREMHERAQDRAREQAEHVGVSWVPKREYGMVRNHSKRPITNIVAGIAFPLPDGGTNTIHAREWGIFHEGREQVITVGEHSGVTSGLPPSMPVLTPFQDAKCLFDRPPGDEGRLLVRFYDDAAHRWQLDHFMHLEPAPDDKW